MSLFFRPAILEKLRAGGKAIRIGHFFATPTGKYSAVFGEGPCRSLVPRLAWSLSRSAATSIRDSAACASRKALAKQLDAVILAFAGLIRLWNDEKGREELRRLLQGVRWMVLPLEGMSRSSGARRACDRMPSRRSAYVSEDSKNSLRSDGRAHVAIERGLLAAVGWWLSSEVRCHCDIDGESFEIVFRPREESRTLSSSMSFVGRSRRLRARVVAWDGNEWRSECEVSADIAGLELRLPLFRRALARIARREGHRISRMRAFGSREAPAGTSSPLWAFGSKARRRISAFEVLRPTSFGGSSSASQFSGLERSHA